MATAVGACASSGGTSDDDLLDGASNAFDPACPAAGHLARDVSGQIRPNTPTPPNYSFLYAADDGCAPLRFNPCEPIHYVTNEAFAHADDIAVLDEALRRISEATGITFVHEGTTDEVPGRRGAVNDRYGERWSPVLIAWVDNAAMARFVGASLPRSSDTTVPISSFPGGGTPVPVKVGDVSGLVSGLLVINVDATLPDGDGPIPYGFGPGINWGRVLLHELGHLIGLGHVLSRSEIMQHELRLQTISSNQWGVGDLLALGAIGTEAGCVEAPSYTPRPGFVGVVSR